MQNKTHPTHRILLILPLILAMTLLTSTSCKVGDDENTFAQEMEELKAYIRNNNITVTPRASGLYYIERQAGTGENAKPGQRVTVQYSGKLLNGTVFDSGTFSFTLGTGRVIAGWDEGIALMKKGGVAQLIIPSTLAYGATGYGSIPPYSSLIFDISLLNIQ